MPVSWLVLTVMLREKLKRKTSIKGDQVMCVFFGLLSPVTLNKEIVISSFLDGLTLHNDMYFSSLIVLIVGSLIMTCESFIGF